MTTMTTTTEQNTSKAGFAIPLEGDTDLGLALLIVEDEQGHYDRSGTSARSTKRNTSRRTIFAETRTPRCDEDPGLCPRAYKLWARGIDGGFRVACEIEA